MASIHYVILFTLIMGGCYSFRKRIGFMKERMGRAERRRAQKLKQKEKTTTYNLTKAQLDVMVREKIGDELIRVKQEATDDAVNTAMVLLLTLPLEVLMDHYWTKSYAKRIPKFTERVLDTTNAGKMVSWIWKN